MTNKFLVLLLALVYLFSLIGMANASQASMAQSSLPLTEATANQCDNPTVNLLLGTTPTGTKYNESTLNAPLNTCVKITFQNTDTKDHTFRIDADSANNVTYFNIYTNPGDTNTSNFMTPNKAMSIQYYCAEPNHKDQGMVGTLVVGGSSGSSPGFDALSLFVALFTVATIFTVYKKKKNNF